MLYSKNYLVIKSNITYLVTSYITWRRRFITTTVREQRPRSQLATNNIQFYAIANLDKTISWELSVRFYISKCILQNTSQRRHLILQIPNDICLFKSDTTPAGAGDRHGCRAGCEGDHQLRPIDRGFKKILNEKRWGVANEILWLSTEVLQCALEKAMHPSYLLNSE